MKELERHNMTHLREQFHAHPLGQETLTLLWNSASACPEILRLSPHRTVLRCEGPRRQNWVLKIFHPKRSWERFRRVFSNYPALREYQVHQSLGLGEALTEQLTPTLGVFARPWLEEAEAEISPTTWGTGLARLHNEGWSDSDLSMDDFLFVKQKLTPLDLNHATYTSGGASISIRKRNLIQLVSQTAPEKRGPFSVALLDAYSEESCAKFPTGDVLNKATEEFRSHLWKRSARAWRDCSHFSIQSLGTKGSPVVWRRDSARPSEKWTLCEDGSSACVSQSEEMFRKDYFRFRGRLRGPAKNAHRRFHLLELLGLPCARSLGFSSTSLWTSKVTGPPCDSTDVPEIANWLRKLHAFGFGCRDPKSSNFVRTPDGPCLVDADGITPKCTKPMRDLGRLLAETHPNSSMESLALSNYGPCPKTELDKYLGFFRGILGPPTKTLTPPIGSKKEKKL